MSTVVRAVPLVLATYCTLCFPCFAQCPGQWLPPGALADLNGDVWATSVWDPDGAGPQPPLLVAGGPFTTASGNTVNHIAAWNGVAWLPLGTGITGGNAWVLALTTFGGDLIACGSFSNAGGPASNIARWNGVAWQPLGSGLGGDFAWALAEYNGELIVGGQFATAGGSAANNIARWNGSTSQWASLDSGMTGPAGQVSVNALAVHAGELIAGGSFITASGGAVNHIARWAGSVWSSMGTGMNADVWALTTYRGELIAGGDFTSADGVSANRIARWTGSTFAPMGAGMNSTVGVFAVHKGGLIAGGEFTSAGGGAANRIARWNTVAWEPLGSGANNSVLALSSLGDTLFAGGRFSVVGGASSPHMAKWTNGSCPPAIIYVRAGAAPGGNGASWDTAYRFLTDALHSAAPIALSGQPVQVWIASGLYRPDQSEASPSGTGNGAAAFELLDRVSLYGGFNGTETTLSDRNSGVNIAILAGATPDPQCASCIWSQSIVRATDVVDQAVLDGVTISAQGRVGSAVRLTRSGVELVRCKITDHISSSDGIGARIEDCSPTFRFCEFSRNKRQTTVFSDGAGAYVTGGLPLFEDCLFSDNIANAEGAGGGVLGPSILRRCTFSGNRAGVSAAFSGAVLVEDCVCEGNAAGYGRSVGSATTVRASVFRNNSVFGQQVPSGALFATSVENCVFLDNLEGCVFGANVRDCIFIGNSDPTHPPGAGSGVHNCPTVTDCVFINNSATAAAFSRDFAMTVTNCVFFGNPGPAVYVRGAAASCTIHNSIFWQNADETEAGTLKVHPGNPGTISIDHSFIQGLTGALGGVGNIGAYPYNDPFFVDAVGPDNQAGSGDEDLRLSAGSPCIDAGVNSVVPGAVSVDIDLNPRFQDDTGTIDTGVGSGPIVDMGPYEFQGTSCPADINHDGFADAIDYDVFVAMFLAGDIGSDFNRDGFSDAIDYDGFIIAFLRGC